MVAAYSIYYVCRMSLSVVKQPIIDSGVLTPGQLGLVGSAFLFVYAAGKFTNGFIADYCNIRRFMATGLLVSSLINLLMGVAGLLEGTVGIVSLLIFFIFAIVWGINGWAQSMGSPPGVIQLSRWFPLSKRGTYYSIFSSTPYIGEFLAFIIVGVVVGALGWQFGFIFASVAGLIGSAVVLVFVSDTPESKGLPSIQEISGEAPRKEDTMPTVKLQKMVLSHPGIWIIAASSAFVYITKYAVAGWGVLFLQKAKEYSLEDATQIIKPAIISGIFGFISLAFFLFTNGSYIVNVVYVSLFSLFIGVLYCIVAGLMAVDIVPRKATGAALGVVGISSYVAAGLQDITSGYLIEGFSVAPQITEGLTETEILAATTYDFGPVSIFWLIAALIAFLLPVLFWKKMQRKDIDI